MLAAGKEVYSEIRNLVVWAKTNAGQGTFYRSQHELIPRSSRMVMPLTSTTASSDNTAQPFKRLELRGR